MCLDERSHGVSSLAYAKLAGFQGASLLVHNDSVFRESDFESISRIGDSVKRTQVGKTGRFGVGFNSVYHLTDMPGFVSGRHVVFFDPHCAFLPNVSASNPGKRIDFVKNDVLAAHPDQFEPFRAFGCDMRAEYRGTTFRFPLRTPEQASLSKLSKASYDANGVRALLAEFAKEAALDALFLKNVEVVDVLEWAPGDAEPKLVARTALHSPTAALRTHRGQFTRASTAFAADEPIEPPTVFEATFESTNPARRPAGDSSNDLGAPPPAEGPSRRTFLVSQALGSPALDALVRTGREKFGMKLVPWASVAAEIGGSEESGSSGGRAFCFLPLPARTGLPVHVNAYFELSSNRRDIWFGGDMAGGGAARSEWNQSLLERVVAPAYARLLERAAETLGNVAAYLSLLPRGRPPEPWGGVVRATCAAIVDLRVLYTRADGGRWITPREATFPDPELERNPELAEALWAEGEPLADAPPEALACLAEHAAPGGFAPRRVTPAGVRALLRGKPPREPRPRARALTLLEYCLSDIVDEDAAGSAAALEGLPLVPLADGSHGVVRARGAPGAALMIVPASVEEVRLMRNAGDLRVDVKTTGDEKGGGEDHEGAGGALTARLAALARNGALNLRTLDGDALLAIMPRIVPSAWKREAARGGEGLERALSLQEDVPWLPPRDEDEGAGEDAASSASSASDASHPSVATLARLWRRLAAVRPDDLAGFAGWPIVPIRGAIAGERALAPLGASVVGDPNAAARTSDRVLDAGVVDALRVANVRVFAAANPSLSFGPGGGNQPSGNQPRAPEEKDPEETNEGASSYSSSGPRSAASVSSVSSGRCPAAAACAAHPAYRSFTRPASGAGVADALAATLRVEPTRRSPTSGTNDAPMNEAPSFVSPAFARRDAAALRGFLMRRAWFGAGARVSGDGDAGTPARLATIRALRVFEAHAELGAGAEEQSSGTLGDRSPPPGPLVTLATSSSSGEVSTGNDSTGNDDDAAPLRLAPPGADPRVLGPRFLNPSSDEERHALEKCVGVPRASAPDVLRARVLRRLDRLPAEVIHDVMLAALASLGSLAHADATIADAIAAAPFVPVGVVAKEGATDRFLRSAPRDVYDPRIPELVALLDPDRHFPAPPFRDESALNALAGLGMRNGVTRRAVLDAARAAEAARDEGDDAAAVRRGRAVLAYLCAPDGTALVAPNRTRERGGGVASVFAGLFGGGQGGGGKASSGERRERERRDKAEEEEDLTPEVFLARLRDVAWVPARVAAPEEEPGLPWPLDAPGVAPPRVVRPFDDAWLCSATRRILDDEGAEGVVPPGGRGGGGRTGGRKFSGRRRRGRSRRARNTSAAAPSVRFRDGGGRARVDRAARRGDARGAAPGVRGGTCDRRGRTRGAEARGGGAEGVRRAVADPEPTGVRRREGDARRTRARGGARDGTRNRPEQK